MLEMAERRNFPPQALSSLTRRLFLGSRPPLDLFSPLRTSGRGGDADSPGSEAAPHTSRAVISAAWEYDQRSLRREAWTSNSVARREDGAPPGPYIVFLVPRSWWRG